MSAPLDDDNLLSEILLRLPPQPSSLPRASAVSKRWHSLASDPAFSRRFRLHHRRNPPILGLFLVDDNEIRFQPTLDPPNRVPERRFSTSIYPGDRSFRFLGCRHGFALILHTHRWIPRLLVWDPVNGHEHPIAIPAGFTGVVETAYGYIPKFHGAVLRASHGDIQNFQVVLATTDEQTARVFIRVYSSQTGVWGKVISSPLPPNDSNLSPRAIEPSNPAVLVGDSLYFLLAGESPIFIEFDVDTHSLAAIPLPAELDSNYSHLYSVVRAEGGGPGLLFVSELCGAKLWMRKTDCDGVASWELGTTVEPDDLLSPDHCWGISIEGFAEENNVVFFGTFGAADFMFQLDSLQYKKLLRIDSRYWHPFECVYAAGALAARLSETMLDNFTMPAENSVISAVSKAGAPPARVSQTLPDTSTMPSEYSVDSSVTKAGAPFAHAMFGTLRYAPENSGISSGTKDGSVLWQNMSGILTDHSKKSEISLATNSVEVRQIGRDDLRLKLMRKGLSKKSNSDTEHDGVDLREKLSRNAKSLQGYEARGCVPESRSSYDVREVPESGSGYGSRGRVPESRASVLADDLFKVDSSGKPYSSWAADGLRHSSPDNLPSVRRDLTPPRSVRRDLTPPRSVRRDVTSLRSALRGMSPPRSARRGMSPPRSARRGMSPPRSVRRGISPPRSVRRGMSPPRTYDQTRPIPPVGSVGATRPSSHITRDARDTLRARHDEKSTILLDTLQPANGISSSGARLPTDPVLKEVPLTVTGLLNSLGLDKYVVLFQGEEVDMTALSQMKDSDLKDMGVPMGPRKKILQAAAPYAKQWQRCPMI